MEIHPWTNLKTNSVRVLNNAQKLWGPSSLQGVVNTTHMVRSLDKICIRSKLQTAGIFTKAQSWNMGDKGHYVQKWIFAWCVFSLASIHSHVLRDSGRGGSKDHNVLHFHRLHFTSNCCCTPRKKGLKERRKRVRLRFIRYNSQLHLLLPLLWSHSHENYSDTQKTKKYGCFSLCLCS